MDQGYLSKKAQDLNRNKGNVSPTMTQEERVNKYFGELDKSVVHRLYEAYKFDFELFGYSAEPYL